MEHQLTVQVQQVSSKPKYVKMDHATFMYYLRANADKLFRCVSKSCSCDPGDLRLQDNFLECGACGKKLKYK